MDKSVIAICVGAIVSAAFFVGAYHASTSSTDKVALRTMTDLSTGCEYVVWQSGPSLSVTPRIGSDGLPSCSDIPAPKWQPGGQI